MRSEDSLETNEDEGVEIIRSSTHEEEIVDCSNANGGTIINKKEITVLISSGNFNHTQTAHQNSALQILNDLSLPYVTIDGMDADLKAKRDALFEISGIRGNYPQLFLTSNNQGARKTMAATSFLGDFAWLENNSAVLVDMMMPPPPVQLAQQQSLSEAAEKGSIEFDSRLSGLSTSEGESVETGKSSNNNDEIDKEHPDPTLTPKATANKRQVVPENNGAPERQVDWIPEEGVSDSSFSGVTSQAVKADDVTETSFTTMTTVGDGGAAPPPPMPLTAVDESGIAVNDTFTNTNNQTTGAYVRPIGRNKLPARSPRPPRRMRAVDWCPPQHQPQHPPQQTLVPRMSNSSISGITPSVVTSRAVRMADDNTITTFATMTTMGDAGSILEEDMEDEESSSDEENDEGGEEEEEEENGGEGMVAANGVVRYEDSMEEVEDGDGVVVDKIPKYSKQQREISSSTGTNQAVRAPDDQSMVTFATMTTFGDQVRDSDVVDRLPSFTAAKIGESVATNDTVQMGDHESVATWATMNTMKGQITGNVVDHVPADEEQSVPSNPNAGTEPGSSLKSVRTSNAVQDERSITTFTTNTSAFTEQGIQEVVDKIPTFAGGSGRSVMSGVTNQAIRMNDDRSTASFATMTTAGDVASLYEAEVSVTEHNQRPRLLSEGDYEFDELDRSVVDTIPEATSSVASGTTNHSVQTGEEASVTTFATMTTAGVDKVPSSNVVSSSASATTNRAVRVNDDQSVATWATMATSGNVNDHVVDKTPAATVRSDSSIVSGTTNHAVKDREDQSVVTWNTMTTAGARAPAPYAVDRVPSFHNSSAPSISGDTNQAVRAPDDQSVVTFATMTTVGYSRENSDMVDKIPSFNERTGTSMVTSDTVQMGDNDSVATWATMNTMRGQITGNVVDHVPSEGEDVADPSQRSLHTSNAVQDERSINTFTTNATAFTERGIQEVVDKIPTFAGGSGRSVMSGVTNQAIRMNDDRSTASFATMTTAGDMPQDRADPTLVDRIPSFAGGTNTSISGRTDAAVKVGDDLTATTFATLTTVGEANIVNSYQNEEVRNSDHSGIDEVMSTSSRPTAGILKESRHGTKRESTNFLPAIDGADLPINAGESVSNSHLLRAITDLRFHVDYRIGELREINRRDSERVLQIVQQEQARRTALEARLHAQLLMQSESMVAMELKVLRLEAKISSRDSNRQRRHQSNGGVTMDRLPPIAATPSTPNQSDEEADSFEELDLTPRAARSSTLGQVPPGGGSRGGPTNIAVVTRSGASVASAVTAMSFPEESFSHMDHGLNDNGSEDGDVEDEGDDNDGSQSTPTQGSRNQISNLESILLNPIQADQGISTRATRGETDGNSSLPTSVTSTTMASTVVTATTRGDTSVGIPRISSRASEDALTENIDEQNGSMSDDRPRSRSQSPLTVQSAATETLQSVASMSLGPSILSTAAIAPARAFGTRRANAAIAAANAEARSLSNRVVSFTTNDLVTERAQPPQETDGGGDSITMPDDLDNLSDIADVFSNSARAWREEYEARLDAIHKRLDR